MLALIIITLGILSRVIVHTPNFTPVLSLSLLGGIYLKGRQALLVPLALMVISDLIIGFYPMIFFSWGSILLISALGIWIREKKNLANVLGGSLASAVIFFIVSNFGAWLALYPHTMNGLRECYILAVPFFRSTLVSSVGYSLVFFTGFEWLLKREKIHTIQGNLV